MLEEIVAKVADLEFSALSDKAKERLLLSLLCNLSVAVAGVRYAALPEPPADPKGRYRLLSGRSTGDARQAAFWNAAVMHARTQDDFHPVGNLHIGTVVLPALMAVADATLLSGAEFLGALAAGYMVAVGLSRSASPLTTPRGLRSTSLYAPFGASAAVSKARRLQLAQMLSAIALTTAFNAGQTQTWIDGSDEWKVHAGVGAEAGLVASDLAMAGVKGGAHALDGPAGFFAAVVGRKTVFADIADDFDASAAIEENVIKKYPVSGICQSVVLASERAAAKLRNDQTIAGVRIEMNPFEMHYPGNLNRGPFRSFGDRLMSAAFCSASVLRHHGFDFVDFHSGPEAERDRLIEATRVVEDDSLPLLSSRVTVTLKDGSTATEHVENSRSEVAIDWDSVDAWASGLWREGGRTDDDYRACREAILRLPNEAVARLCLPTKDAA